MVSKAFFTGSRYLVEDNDGRQDYFRYEGETFLSALTTAGRKVLDTSFDADDQKAAYMKALVCLNESYFEAREYEDEAKGRYYKHDERSERHFRFKTAERLSDRVDDLHKILSAHDALVNAAADDIRRTHEEGTQQEALSAMRSTLFACTDLAVSDAWYPTIKTYYYSLSPGELVAEDRERRKQRIEGTESSLGIEEILEKPVYRKLTRRDLRRVRQVNRQSPGQDSRTWKRLHNNYWWYLSHEYEEDAVPAGSSVAGSVSE